MRAVAIYLRERFPLAATALMAVSFAATSVGFFSVTPAFSAWWWAQLALLAVFYEALLLRYRVTDEWKDFAHDNAAYPERPVQRGAISIATLAWMGVVAFVVELACVVVLGGGFGLLLYIPVLAYSLLTAVEFFAKAWLAAHFTAAVVVHQLIYVLLFVWVALVLGSSLGVQTWVGIAAATLVFFNIEIVRKFEPRLAPDGAIVPDSYGAMWGRTVTVWLIVGVIVAAGLLAYGAGAGFIVAGVSVVFAVLIVLLRANSTAVIYLTAAHAVALSILVLL